MDRRAIRAKFSGAGVMALVIHSARETLSEVQKRGLPHLFDGDSTVVTAWDKGLIVVGQWTGSAEALVQRTQKLLQLHGTFTITALQLARDTHQFGNTAQSRGFDRLRWLLSIAHRDG